MSCCTVDIRTFDLRLDGPVVLSAEEAARAARFLFEKDRKQWAQARSALRRTLAGYVGAAPEALEFVYGENGKPALAGQAGVEFNISHAGGWAMIAVTRGVPVGSPVPVGVDIEAIREHVDIAKLLRRLGETELSGGTVDLFHVWTRREARTKAMGGQLMMATEGDVRVVDVRAPEGFAGSVALVGADPEPRYCGE